MATQNKDGLPIKEGQNVGLTAGMATDERTTLHDKVIPEFIKATWTDPQDSIRSEERDFSLRESHDYHERIEKALMLAGMVYLDAHRWATEVEHFRQVQMGFNPNQIEELAKPYVDMAAHRAKAEEAVASKKLDDQPYVQQGDGATELLNRPVVNYAPCLYDRDGEEYEHPKQLRLLNEFDAFVACNKKDGSYAVLEPSTGMLLSHGHLSDDAAREAAELLAARRGTIFMRRWIEAEPALSQQQLKEKYDVRSKAETAEEVRGHQEEDGQGGETSEGGEDERGEDHELAAQAGADEGGAAEEVNP